MPVSTVPTRHLRVTLIAGMDYRKQLARLINLTDTHDVNPPLFVDIYLLPRIPRMYAISGCLLISPRCLLGG